MEYCRCCVKDVSDQAEKKQRRLLSSATMQTTLQTLKDFVSKLQADEKLDDIEDGFICRSCVRLLERFRKANEEVVCNVVKVLPLLRAANLRERKVIPSTQAQVCLHAQALHFHQVYMLHKFNFNVVMTHHHQLR